MFKYESDQPRCWRPDLVPAILAWLDTVPDSELYGKLQSLRVGALGEFRANFVYEGRDLRVEFDHDIYLTSDGVHMYTAPAIERFSLGNIAKLIVATNTKTAKDRNQP